MKKEMLFQMEEILKKENQKIILVLIDYLNEKYNSQDAAMEMWRQKRQSDLEILEFLGQENRESYRKFRKNITPGDGEYFFMGEAD